MAIYGALTHCNIFINGLDLTGDSNMVKIEAVKEVRDRTVFGNTARVRSMAGLSEVNFAASGFHNSAAAGQDAERLYRAAHTLKGSIGNFAADSAFAAAREVEMIGRRGELASAGDALAALESELGRLGADLNALYRDGG